MNIKVKDLVWDKWNRSHIEKHNLVPRQVNQILLDKHLIYRPTHTGRMLLTGRCGKRLVTAILNPQLKKYYVVTARDASKPERQIYRDNL